MGKFNHISNNFKTGEFSPKMRARTELEEYRTSVERLVNVIPTKQGSGNKRSGAKYMASLTANTNIVKTIPFVFSKTESYVISIDTISLPATHMLSSFADYIQDFDNNQHSTHVPGAYWSTASRYDSIDAADFLTITRNDGTDATVFGELGHVFDGIGKSSSEVTTQNTFYYDPYPIEIYNIIGADPRGFHYAQSGDVMILTHKSGDIPPIVIARLSIDSFTVSWFHNYKLRSFDTWGASLKYYAGVLRYPTLPTNTTPVTIAGTLVSTHRYDDGVTANNTTGYVNLYDVYTLTATQDPTLGVPFFNYKDLGKTITVKVLDPAPSAGHPVLQDVDFTIVAFPSAAASYATCTAITSRYQSGAMDQAVNNSATRAKSFVATDDWKVSAWGGRRGWPRTVCFFEQRLVFGGTTSDVDTVWTSQTGDIFKFLGQKFVQDASADWTQLRNYIPSNIPDKDKVVDIFGNVQLQTDPTNFKPSSQEINAIQWLSSGQSLMVGTLGAEYIVSGDGAALSATSINYRRQTSRGGDPVMPVRVDDEVLYILRDGRSVNNFKYNRNNGSFLSGDITSHADHIVDVGNEATVSQFVQLEYCTSRDLLLAITDDNYLLGFTYSPQNNTMAWHRYDVTGDVLSVCSIPSANGDVDEIWICVLRSGIRTLEKVGIDFLGSSVGDPNHPALFLDSHVSRTNLAAIETIDMSHLLDLTVNVYVDGAFSFSQLLSTGNTDVDLPISTTAIVGLPYSAIIETNDLKAGGDFGSPVGNIQRLDRVTGIFYRSMNVKVGKTEGPHFDLIPGMSTLVSGNKNIDFPAGSSEDGARITIKSEDAFPMTVLGLVARGITSDR